MTTTISRFVRYLLATFAMLAPAVQASAQCGAEGLAVQVLGSGGPELTDRRASSAYLLWQEGQARLLIDMGPGSLLRFEESGARVEDLQAILLSHLHVDHSADLPALVKGAFFTARDRDLPVYGPTGNRVMPATGAFIDKLFASSEGAFHYLDAFLSGQGAYRLIVNEVAADGDRPITVIDDERFRVSAIAVHHGPIPALAWRVDIAGKRVVFSGDMNGERNTLERLADKAHLLIAHHAIPQGLQGVARNLHMPPTVIGRIAATADVGRLVLSHRMLRTIGREDESSMEIRRFYRGPLVFAEDGQCFPLQ